MKWEKIFSLLGHTNNFEISNHFFGWLVIAFLFLILETTSPGLFFFSSFFFGGLIAAVSTYFTASLAIQTTIFLVSSSCFLVILRYWILPSVTNRSHQTNVYALRGKHGIVVKDITFTTPGFVKINGETWVARILKDEIIKVGDKVEVIDIRGAHVIVKKE